MTKELTLGCTKCGLQMVVIPPDGPSQVTCPNCFQRTLLFPGQEPQTPSDDRIAEFDHLPEPIIVSTKAPKPATSKRVIRRAARKAYKHTHRDQIRKTRVRYLQNGVLAIVLLGSVSALGAWGYTKLRDVPKESWAAVVPGMSTPDKLVREYATLCESFQDACASIQDTASRDRAIGPIETITSRFRGYAKRIEAMDPITETQLESLQASFQEQVTQNAEAAHQKVRQLRENRHLISVKFMTALQDYAIAMDEAAEVMKTQWLQERTVGDREEASDSVVS